MMREYAIEDYGLLISDDVMKTLASHICNDYTESAYEDDMYFFEEKVRDRLGIEYIGEFTGEARKILDNGADDWGDLNDANVFSSDVIYYLPCDRYPTLFKAAYQCMDAIISEMRHKVGNYLPSDFDYRGYIRHIVGTYYG